MISSTKLKDTVKKLEHVAKTETTEYKIEVKTGGYHNAGTNHTIKLEIVGNKTKTRLRTLDNITVNDFKRDQLDRYTKFDVDVGVIEFIGIYVKSNTLKKRVSYNSRTLKEQPWYVETIKISRIAEAVETPDEYVTEEEVPIVWEEFPIYSWIFPSPEIQYFFTNKTSILPKESITRKLSKMRSQQNMNNYVSWMPHEDKLNMFPGYISEKSPENLNINLKFTDNKQRDFTANRMTVLRSVAFASVRNNFKDFFEFQDYSKAAKQLNKNKWMGLHYLEDDKWMEDEEFGRQMMNGMNPALIELCRTLPDNFPVQNEHVALLLARGLTLQEEIEQGNVYIIDLKILQGVSTGSFRPGSSKEEKKLQLAVPLCLLYHDSDGQLRPIAIQLGQEPGSTFPIWTPNDGKWAWLLAKMWFRNAEYQIHQMRCHLALTHLLVEPIAIATFRCLPPQHPVHKLLREHLYYVIAINVIGRSRLIAPVSLFIKCCCRKSCFKS